MTDAERIWQSKSDDDLLEAAGELGTYTEEGQRIIRAELLRRGLEDPVEQAGEAVAPAEPEDAEDEAEDEARGVDCLRCDVPLKFAGEKRFHEGTHWGAIGELGHLFEKTETFQVFVCPRCGHVEFFVDVEGGR
jgi:hypothetical protein